MGATIITREGFHEVLGAPGRSAEIKESQDVYGWLVGSWELDACAMPALMFHT